MSISPDQLREEEQHLAFIMKEIDRQLAKLGEVARERRNKVVEVRKFMWEEIRHDRADWSAKLETAGDVVRDSLELARIERSYLSAQKAIEKLNLLHHSPYFGRIDFIEDGTDGRPMRIYIGLSTLMDDETLEPIIFDWRTPIASMYYDYALGRAQYDTMDGPVTGEITLKRQFKIANGRIEFVFDTGIQIGDDMLQMMLGKSSDDKMRSIVTTIQREQNRIIRNEEYPVLIVQGAAGSGKTSIALQRVAYLLYKHRKVLQSDQMVLFSPNPLFNDYISNVLPELGEENMQQTTFQDYAEHRLGRFLQLEDRYAQMEHLLTLSPDHPNKDTISASIGFKVSADFLAIINRYVDLLANERMPFKPVMYGKQVWMSEEQLRKQFYETYARYPIHARLERMAESMSELLPELEERQVKKLYQRLLKHPKYLGTDDELMNMSRNQVHKKVSAMHKFVEDWEFVDPLEAYKQLFRDENLFRTLAAGLAVPSQWENIRQYTLLRLEQEGVVPYEDVPPLLYLYESITGFHSFNNIRHVILDEAQDYSPFQYEIIRRLFPRSNLTLLGDLNQAIQPHMRIESYDFVKDLFGHENTTIMRLTKSYRSTTEIVEFTKAMLPGGEAIEAFSRNGDKPLLIEVPNDPAERARRMVRDLMELREAGMNTIAVICKTAQESREAYEALLKAGAPEELRLITKDDVKYSGGLVVLPVYLAKGLEFDAVIIHDASADRYGSEDERKLFYTACTRPLHLLHLYYSGDVTSFIAEIDPVLYDRALS